MPFKFEKLIVWQKAVDLSDFVNQTTKLFPKEEMYILSSQMKRAADSVSLNIAEGSTGQTTPEFKRFHLAKRRGYISNQDFDKIYKMCEEILVMINALRNSLK